MYFEKFILENRKYWKEKDTSPEEEGAIYFENITETFFPLMLGKFLTAKGLQKRKSRKITAFKYKIDSEYGQLCESFGVEAKSIFKSAGIKAYVAALYQTIKLLIMNLFGFPFADYKYKDVLVGDLIYDHIVRTGKKYTIGKTFNYHEILTIFKGFLIANLCERLFKEQPPAYFLAGDIIYLNGIMVRFAIKYHGKIIIVTTGKKNYEYPENKIKAHYAINSAALYEDIVENIITSDLPENWEKIVDTYLENIYQGIGDWNTENAYKNKLLWDGKEVLKEIGIQNNKKNILIMPHCFSDAPHCANYALYKDYYEWFVKTLELIKDIKNVNWIIKEHPCHAAYGESGSVEKLYQKYKADNIYWLPNNFSTAVVPKFADAIITVRGTAGMEMSCQGIRSILAGHSYYSEAGFTYTPKTINEYEKLLHNLDSIEKLSEEEITKAKKTLYGALDFLIPFHDEYQELASEAYQKYRKNTDEDIKYEEEFWADLLKLCKTQDMSKSYCYEWGKKNSIA